MLKTNSVVALFNLHTQAEEAVKQLQQDGFDMKKLSIAGKDYEKDEDVAGGLRHKRSRGRETPQ